MKSKLFLEGMFGILLAFGLVLAGCDTGGGGGDGGGNPSGGNPGGNPVTLNWGGCSDYTCGTRTKNAKMGLVDDMAELCYDQGQSDPEVTAHSTDPSSDLQKAYDNALLASFNGRNGEYHRGVIQNFVVTPKLDPTTNVKYGYHCFNDADRAAAKAAAVAVIQAEHPTYVPVASIQQPIEIAMGD
jgi:hypothetical protein